MSCFHGNRGYCAECEADDLRQEVKRLKREVFEAKLAAGVLSSQYDAWEPTKESVGALPIPIRRYIHDIELLLDPEYVVLENRELRKKEQEVLAFRTRVMPWLSEAREFLHQARAYFYSRHPLQEVQEGPARGKRFIDFANELLIEIEAWGKGE